MRRLDDYFIELGVPLVARQLTAIAEACFDLGEQRPLPRPREPIEGVYSGDDFLLQVLRWYDATYGDALKIEAWIPPSMIYLRGESWKVQCPAIFGPALFYARDVDRGPAAVYAPSGVAILQIESPERTDPGLRKYDVLDFIKGFPVPARDLISKGELISILTVICRNRAFCHHLVAARHHKFMEEAIGDVTASVDLLLKRPPQTGDSKWAALQATEKAFKSFLEHAGAQYPTGGREGHDLKHLAALVTAAGGPTIRDEGVDRIQCSAGVRYDASEVDRTEAMQAHHAALEIAGIVAFVNCQRHPIKPN